MPHEIAKLLLEHAGSCLQRAEAIKTALSLGMPLNEVEAYLDWLDSSAAPHPQQLTQDEAQRGRENPSS